MDAGSEYGTNKAMLIGSLHEAESLSEVHLSVREKLIEVQADLKKWKNETYKKQMVGGCKEAKSFDDEFKKVCEFSDYLNILILTIFDRNNYRKRAD